MKKISFYMRRIILSTLLVMFFIQPPMIAASTAGTALNISCSNYHQVLILVDDTHETLNWLADTLHASLTPFHSNTHIVNIINLDQLQEVLSGPAWILIYLLAGEPDGIQIRDQLLPWWDFAHYLLPANDKHHIFANGNSESLEPFVKNQLGFHIQGEDVIDATLSYIYILWTMADILENSGTSSERQAGKALRSFTLGMYMENASGLYSRAILPVSPLGKAEPTEPSDEQDSFENSITLIGPTASGGEISGPHEYLDYKDVDPILKILPAYNSSSYQDLITPKHVDLVVPQIGEGLPVALLPTECSVSGPAAPILDALLDLIAAFLAAQYGEHETYQINLRLDSCEKIGDKMLALTAEVEERMIVHMRRLVRTNVTSIEHGLLLLQEQGKDYAFDQLVRGEADIISQPLSEVGETEIEDVGDFLLWQGYFKHGLTEFVKFQFKFKLRLYPSFGVHSGRLAESLGNYLLTGVQSNTSTDIFSDLIAKRGIFVIPVFQMDLDIDFFSSGNDFFKKIIEGALSKYIELEFGGGMSLKLAILTVETETDTFAAFKLLELSFRIKFGLAIPITLADILTGGATKSLGPVQEYIGLDAIKFKIYFRFSYEITFKFGKGLVPDQTIGTAKITIGAEAKIFLGVKIKIPFTNKKVEIGVEIKLGIEVTFKFIQGLSGTPRPLEIYIIFHVFVEVYFKAIDLCTLLFGLHLYPFTGEDGIRLNPPADSDEYRENAHGADSDNDGLADFFEDVYPGLNSRSSDTDADGLSDKFELDNSFTDPVDPDTDDDGLNDGQEVLTYKTNPFTNDTDNDRLTDYEEVIIYQTNPFMGDTDEDGLSDYYEINHVYDFVNVTPSVTQVFIGGVPYSDRTDPLNPDTDDDGLLDGEEGEWGVYYANPQYLNQIPTYLPNYGYTHPLDNDTDDDSYLQFDNNGTIHPDHVFLLDMRDGVEITPRWFMLINGVTFELELFLIVTNPVLRDTDGDKDFDAYEIVVIQSDPTDGDEDHDGLLSQYEGTGPESNHTNRFNPDTDGDLLNDLLDTLLDTDPLDPDTDDDLVLDGDEYLLYHTNPVVNDTDHDGLLDGEELYFFYSNPFIQDTDQDGLLDGFEVYVTNTDPSSPDTDRDGLNDGLELQTYNTDPLNEDSDGDGLRDGDEVYVYGTNPADWDSDDDSLLHLNELGEPAYPWGDGDEIAYGTDPLSMDTDLDGLSDAQELYLGLGSPLFDPMPLDPLSNDTDADRLIDGIEVDLQNVTLATYPYWALVIVFPYETSPTNNDSDSDGLRDGDEVFTYGSSPSMNDTDGDTLLDGAEVFDHKTHPGFNDTDGDYLADNWETTNSSSFQDYTPIYGTSALSSDTDEDGLPDGLEIRLAQNGWDPHEVGGIDMDPLDNDTNSDLILDGYQLDFDRDGFTAGEEFYVNRTYAIPGGGITNPDSDSDGLIEGVERIYRTNATRWDTDNDGFSDGDEVAWGTNAVNENTTLEMVNMVIRLRTLNSILLTAGIYLFVGGVVGVFAIPVISDHVKQFADRRKQRIMAAKKAAAEKPRQIRRRKKAEPPKDEVKTKGGGVS